MSDIKKTTRKESDLYPPIKQLLEKQGYEVKAEIGAADVVGCRDDEDPVIVELKTSFSLSLFHQAIERQSLTDFVYIAVFRKSGRASWKALKRGKTLCRRLGLGLITVRPKDGFIEIHLDPAPYKPRKSKVKKARLLKEFASRIGDPNLGGQTRSGLITAYRQDAIRCLAVLNKNGPLKASIVKNIMGVSRARNIMADNHYGWFEKVARGIYAITPVGQQAVEDYQKEIVVLEETKN